MIPTLMVIPTLMTMASPIRAEPGEPNIMDTLTPAQSQFETIRQQTLTLLDELTGKAKDFALPAPPEAFASYRQKLVDNTYQVLVVGEAKRGKSSFVNALIGRAILPVDIPVATSQVFRIRQAEQEAYRLRFGR